MQDKICEYCKKNFKTYRKGQRYCCYECFNKDRVIYNNEQCLQCWKLFHQDGSNKKYCSKECMYKHMRMDDRICEICWTSFHPRKKLQKYCSYKCRWIWTRLSNKVCPICKTSFKPKYRWTIYCSLKCRVDSRRLTEEGKKKRDERNKSKCLYCNNIYIKKRKHQLYCSKECVLAARGTKSKANEMWFSILVSLWYNVSREFTLWRYRYDIKIGDLLIEVNPSPFHNSTRAPYWKAKDKYYHYNKRINAINNWYKYINIRDWTTQEDLLYYINNGVTYKETPNLHWYNPETWEHLLDYWFNEDEMVDKWFVAIYDSWEEIF